MIIPHPKWSHISSENSLQLTNKSFSLASWDSFFFVVIITSLLCNTGFYKEWEAKFGEEMLEDSPWPLSNLFCFLIYINTYECVNSGSVSFSKGMITAWCPTMLSTLLFSMSKAQGFHFCFLKEERVGGNNSSIEPGGRRYHKRPEERKKRERD